MTNFTDERIAEARARCEAATKNPTLDRYGHGGGRASAGDELVADYYNEGDREFYHAARTDLPDALDALVRERLDHTYTVDIDDQLIAEARRRYDEAAQEAHNTLVALVEARRQRDELQELCDEAIREARDGFGAVVEASNKLIERTAQRDEAEALLLWCYRKRGFNFVADEEFGIEALLRKRGLLEATDDAR